MRTIRQQDRRKRRKPSWPLVAIFTATLLAVPAVVHGVAPERALDATSITDAVEDELMIDPAVSSYLIDVATVDGVVSLSGTVDNLISKQRATRIAETVRGVRSVVNRIQVEPITVRSDEQLREDVLTALLENPATDAYELDVTARDGTVNLAGAVESWQERQLSERVAASVRGVREVVNDIDVTYVTDRPDWEIRNEIAETLRWDVLVDHGMIDVGVEDGEVTLTGTVGSAAEKRQAISDSWALGVRSVDASDLEVRLWARDENLRKQKYVVRSDEEIRSAVIDALAIDPRVSSFDVGVETAAGTVTLRGAVDNLMAKRAAEADARNTVGVIGVTNRIKVRPTSSLDAIASERSLRHALLTDPFVERYEVEVDVVNGVAYLDGEVDSYFEKTRAGTLAAETNGVVNVVNRIDVDPSSPPIVYDPYVDRDWYAYDHLWFDDFAPAYAYAQTRDEMIETRIEDQLWWSPFVDADEVNVTVVDGTATLTGSVDTWSERRAAVKNAYDGGAVWVHDELSIQ